MKTINLIKAAMFVSLAVFLSSCDKDKNENGATIKFTSTFQTSKSAIAKSTIEEGILIESFKINIEEIELEFDDNDPMFENDSIASDYELEGPFEIDLMKDGNNLETTIANNVSLPAAAYDEIEFKFRESENSISEMLGKSLLVRGTINGQPFIFWTDEEIEIEIEFDNDITIQEVQETIITVSIDIAALFNPTTGVDISGAIDGNENGIIEIYPGDPDGNSDLADLIWETLEEIIEAFEDQYDD
jgi:hypothetical protein